MEPINEYDPIGGHTQEDADAAYAALFSELHGEPMEGGGQAYAVVPPPDGNADGLGAAEAYAALMQALHPGDSYKVIGDLGAETLYILIGHAEPTGIPCAPGGPEGENSPAPARIFEIIDCHPPQGLTVGYPVRVTIRPAGAVSTLVYGMYAKAGIEAEPPMARRLCEGILDATRRLSTPETTREDRIACAALANMAGMEL